MAGYDQSKADQINQLAQQYPDYDLNTLAFLADVPASDVDNYTIDTNATPATNADYGRATSVQSTEAQSFDDPVPATNLNTNFDEEDNIEISTPAAQPPQATPPPAPPSQFDWSDVDTQDGLDDYGQEFTPEPVTPGYQRPPAPPANIEPQQPPADATELSRQYTQEVANDPQQGDDGLNVYAEDYTQVEPNPVGYERPGLQDDGTIVLDDGDDVNFTDPGPGYAADFDDEDYVENPTPQPADEFVGAGPPPEDDPLIENRSAADTADAFDEEDDIEIVENDGDELTADGQDYSVDDDEAEIAAEQDAEAAAQQAANQANAMKEKARQQQTISQMREASGVKNADGDWRVKLRLAPQATYLYKAANPGILAPLAVTDGIIFPYTPQIDVQYRAEYNNYQPTHSNYMNYFYKGSSIQAVQIQADFTAQDTMEAEYLLAVIHFLKSASKMFYGQDAERGSPPPLLYLTGLGEYQFNEHPCVISEFNYNLPNDVNYIRARSRQVLGTDDLQYMKPLASSASSNSSFASLNRLKTAITTAINGVQAPVQQGAEPTKLQPGKLGNKGATYVPTKMNMTINLLPVATRKQQSQQFSLREYASGNLIKKGMW